MTYKLLGTVALAAMVGLCAFTAPGLADSLPSPDSTALPEADAGKVSAFLLTLQYTGEGWHSNGGVKDSNLYLQGLDVSLDVDAGKLGLPGARFYIEGFYVAGEPVGLNAGAWAAPSALDAFFLNDEVIRFYQAFYEQQIDHTSLLFGFYDIQQHFGTLRPTEVFFNRTFGINTPLALTGLLGGANLPSTYPNTTLGARVKHEFNDQWTAKIGVLNGLSDNPNPPNENDLIINGETGILAIGQIEYAPVAGTKFMLGYWNWTSKFTSWELDASFQRKQYYGAEGFFLGATTRLLTIEGNRRVDGFVNASAADSGTTLVDRAFNTGLTITGPFAERPSDRLGIAINLNHVAEPYRDLLALGGAALPEIETALEITYRAKINDWLTVQPDFQYIWNPSAAPGAEDEYILGIHFEIKNLFKF